MNALVIVLSAVVSNAMAGMFMKALSARTPLTLSVSGILSLLQNPFTWMALATYGCSFILYALALAKLDLSVAYTSIVSGTIILLTILSILVFHEPVTWIRLVGSALIIAGVVLIYRT